MDFDQVNKNANKTKLANLFLGFFEGLFIDGKVHVQEINALIKWVERFPQATDLPYFDNLYKLLVKSVEYPAFLLEKHQDITQLMNQFKSSDFFKQNTCDVQRLHGLLAGIVCDKSLNQDEVMALNTWLKNNDHLEEDPIYIEIFAKLKPVRLTKSVSEKVINDVLNNIRKYVNYDDHGLPFISVAKTSEDGNPDFYTGRFEIIGNLFCVTGASERYSKNDWQEAIEKIGGEFTDSLTKKVDYLVVCNKGNPHWAHMSYGRKFEKALTWQQEGSAIKILTEDNFVAVLEAN